MPLAAVIRSGSIPAYSVQKNDLVGDVDDAVLVADLAKGPLELDRCRIEAALPLDGLDHDGGDVARSDVDLEQVVEPAEGILDPDAVVLDRERRVVDLWRERAEQVLVGRDLAGERHREARAAVKSAVECDDAAAPRGSTSDLHAVLDGLGPGGDEDRLLRRVARHQLVQLLRQTHRDVVGRHHHAGVAEPVELLGYGLLDPGMPVPRVDHRDTGTEVDVTIALNVPDLGVPGALGVDR
jgi:hypothetical protein